VTKAKRCGEVSRIIHRRWSKHVEKKKITLAKRDGLALSLYLEQATAKTGDRK